MSNDLIDLSQYNVIFRSPTDSEREIHDCLIDRKESTNIEILSRKYSL
jgi:hypothetical protein